MRRREFVAGLGSVATPLMWSRAAIAQKSRVPVIGFLSTNSLEADRDVVFDFRRGLRAAGYIEAQNVAISLVIPPEIEVPWPLDPSRKALTMVTVSPLLNDRNDWSLP